MIIGRKISELDPLSALLGTHKFIAWDDTDDAYSVLFSVLQHAISPAGFIQPFGGATAPDGWLPCDGAAVSRTTYAELFTAIGTIWGVGDGSTTFNVPDLRETGLVGTGTKASEITAHDTYTVGQFKDDQGQGHRHSPLSPATGFIGVGGNAINPGTNATAWSNQLTTGDLITDGTNGTPRVGTTTHGKQTGVLYCIRY